MFGRYGDDLVNKKNENGNGKRIWHKEEEMGFKNQNEYKICSRYKHLIRRKKSEISQS